MCSEYVFAGRRSLLGWECHYRPPRRQPGTQRLKNTSAFTSPLCGWYYRIIHKSSVIWIIFGVYAHENQEKGNNYYPFLPSKVLFHIFLASVYPSDKLPFSLKVSFTARENKIMTSWNALVKKLYCTKNIRWTVRSSEFGKSFKFWIS